MLLGDSHELVFFNNFFSQLIVWGYPKLTDWFVSKSAPVLSPNFIPSSFGCLKWNRRLLSHWGRWCWCFIMWLLHLCLSSRVLECFTKVLGSVAGRSMASIPRKDLRFGPELQINCLFVFHISMLHTEQNKRIRAESADNGRLDDTATILLKRRVSLMFSTSDGH